MIKKILIALTVLTVSISLAEANLIDQFTGTWSVEFDRTMEEVKNSPKYNEEEAQNMPALIQRMMEKMKIKVTENELSYVRGAKEAVFPFMVESSEDNTVTLKTSQDDQEFTFTLTLIDGEFMNLKSSASDDMNYYIWTKEKLDN